MPIQMKDGNDRRPIAFDEEERTEREAMKNRASDVRKDRGEAKGPSICRNVSRTASRNSIPSPARSLSYQRAASKASISASGRTLTVILPIAGELGADRAPHPTGGPHPAPIDGRPYVPPAALVATHVEEFDQSPRQCGPRETVRTRSAARPACRRSQAAALEVAVPSCVYDTAAITDIRYLGEERHGTSPPGLTGCRPGAA